MITYFIVIYIHGTINKEIIFENVNTFHDALRKQRLLGKKYYRLLNGRKNRLAIATNERESKRPNRNCVFHKFVEMDYPEVVEAKTFLVSILRFLY